MVSSVKLTNLLGGRSLAIRLVSHFSKTHSEVPYRLLLPKRFPLRDVRYGVNLRTFLLYSI